jgi:hypothetical protein
MSTMAVAMSVRVAMVMVVVMMAGSRWSSSLSFDTSILLQLLSATNVESPRIHAGSLLTRVRQQLDD